MSLTKLLRLALYAAGGLACLLRVSAAPNNYVPLSSNPEHLHPFGDHVYFSADDGIHGRELWRADLSGHAEMVKNITPGADGTQIDHFRVFGGHLFFRARGEGESASLWRTDGTTDGTTRIQAFTSSDALYGVTFIPHHNGKRLFFGVGVDTEDGSSAMWCSDGTPEGTGPLQGEKADVLLFEHYQGAVIGETQVFAARSSATDFGLWRTDGSPEHTHRIATFAELPTAIRALDDTRTVFAGNDGATGQELWITEGTAETTRLLVDIFPGPVTSDPGEALRIAMPDGSPRVLYAATHPEFGRELWESDGTTEGTRMVADVFPGAGSSNPYQMTRLGNVVYFIAIRSDTGKELWCYDLHTGAVTLARDVHPGLPGSDPYAITSISDRFIVFSALDDTHGEELWSVSVSDGAVRLVYDLFPGIESSYPYYSVSLRDRAVFAATSPVYGRELWVAEPEFQTMSLLADIRTDASVNPSSHPEALVAAGDYLYFTANDIENGRELWRTDGTAGGTVLVRDIFPGSASSNPESLVAVGDRLYFSADDGLHGVELWRSDGTFEGTAMEMEINLHGSSNPKHLTVFGEMLLFSAFSPDTGEEPWIVVPGKLPEALKHIAEGARSSSPAGFTVWREHVYFQADDGVHGMELWRTDGTTAGTVMVRDVINAPFEPVSMKQHGVYNDMLYFAADGAGLGTELWSLDVGGTRFRPVHDIAVPGVFDVRAGEPAAEGAYEVVLPRASGNDR